MRRLFFGFLIILTLSGWLSTHAGTCTSISRTNSASLSVLTSSKYNTDLNTVYTAVNALDGGCITDGTLEDGALSTTDFAALLSGLHQGCKVIYSNASTVQIDRCLASVNGNLLRTTSATNVSFGCGGCSAEVASTSYYVYIQTGSAGTSLTGLISTTAPNNDGYDNSGNKVVGRFYNNASSDIDQYSIDQWVGSSFYPTKHSGISFTPTYSGFGTTTNNAARFSRDGSYMIIEAWGNAGTVTGSAGSITLPLGKQIDETKILSTTTNINAVGVLQRNEAGQGHGAQRYVAHIDSSSSLTVVYFSAVPTSDSEYDVEAASTLASGDGFNWTIRVPVLGWGD